MCGILGAIYFNGQRADAGELLRAAQWMKHRGPDDEGSWAQGCVGFAHKRLSILDLSSAGHQPMVSSDGQSVIIYNGECYNFKELRADLQQKGYTFRSHTDTEVLLYGIEEYGTSFISKMNGMFSFALWSQKRNELLLVRDRLGVKPLYIYHDRDKLFFSSEIKPLLSLGVPAVLNEKMLSFFFSLRYCPGDKTLFKGITKLSPGHFMKIKKDGSVEKQCYWTLLDCWDTAPYTLAQAKDKFYELFSSAVSLRQIADVPVGAFLSGGIDSSAIVALMKKNEPNVESFTIGMGADIDESHAAKRVADFVGIKNDAFMLQKSDYCFYEKALWHLEEPIGDSIIAPTYLLAQRAAQRLKVVELGEGADEILGGYIHQLALTYGENLKTQLPFVSSRLIPAVAKMMPQVFWDKVFPYPAQLGSSGVAKVLEYLKSTDTLARRYLGLAGLFDQGEQQDLFAEKFYHDAIAPTDASGVFEQFLSQQKNPIFQNRLLALDLRFWNTDYTLLRMDKLTMAHSLEARVPYLDYRLVEFCLKLPRELKTKGFKQKILLREALKGKNLLPQETIAARKKAFYLPIEKCFDEKFQDYMKDVLLSDSLRQRNIFNRASMEKLLNAPNRELVNNKQVMALLVFELWARMFLDGNWDK